MSYQNNRGQNIPYNRQGSNQNNYINNQPQQGGYNNQNNPRPNYQGDDFYNFPGMGMPNMDEFNDDDFGFFGGRQGGMPNIQGMLAPFEDMMKRMNEPFKDMQGMLPSMDMNSNVGAMEKFNDNKIPYGDYDRSSGANINKGMSRPGAFPGTVLCKSYISTTKMNKDGKPEKECFQSQSINQYHDGHRIQERQEAYKNSYSGVEKAAHQRMLDDRGHKCVRERNRNTGEQNEHNLYKGMQENELEGFNNQFNDMRNKSGFQNNYKLLGQMNFRRGNNMGNNNMLPSGNEPQGGYRGAYGGNNRGGQNYLPSGAKY